MAEETKVTSTETVENGGTETQTPSIDELLAQLAQERADKEKYKTANDKLSKSEAEMKRQLRAKLTAEEQEAEAQKEAQRLADEERESMRRELNHIKAVNAYKGIEDEKAVETLIDAVSEADHIAIATIIENEKKKAVAIAEAEWLKTRPRMQSGQYSSMTKEQIMGIADPSERVKAIASNPHLF